MKRTNTLILKLTFLTYLMLSFMLYADTGRFEEIEGKDGNIIVKDLGTASNLGLKTLFWTKKYAENQTWYKAGELCNNLEYGGYNDWRLPNLIELKSLMNDKKHPASDFLDMPNETFWTSSSYENSEDYVWLVYFNHGYVLYANKNVSTNVRCVRP